MANMLIVGCGDLGMRLAHALAEKGHQVTGLKRHPPPHDSRIRYVAADIASGIGLDGLDTDFDQLFFIVTPDGRSESDYHAIYEIGLHRLLTKLPRCPWIFVSSTGVYAQSQGEWVDENSPAEPEAVTNRLIRQAEKQLIESNSDNIIVRFSGIYGPGRESLLRMAAQSPAIQKEPPYFTNRIHQLDCVGVLDFLLEQRLKGRKLENCYLASDDDPTPLWNVTSWLAERMHCAPPVARAVGKNAAMNKRCSNRRLRDLGYQFRYPDYKKGYAELIDKDRLG
ncbi:NAD-dependent epimerase/dehydratase family protein [Methylobacter sp. YRD-M1]|uniref:NAD-dependent epimerase/dehydratase family protein n=1 Tax=Methylobacter sp. YRD-M1 TaxID=2911520 RepID=UPI00227AD936|nr:NAD-dependent epimerase/dehydratase family protein [Methylobacter sp. YRD-M1]WAK00438.1 SDR family NAD(P)-dependent oxidoreductase [Methylobacter sp. YRD-M1]